LAKKERGIIVNDLLKTGHSARRSQEGKRGSEALLMQERRYRRRRDKVTEETPTEPDQKKPWGENQHAIGREEYRESHSKLRRKTISGTNTLSAAQGPKVKTLIIERKEGIRKRKEHKSGGEREQGDTSHELKKFTHQKRKNGKTSSVRTVD